MVVISLTKLSNYIKYTISFYMIIKKNKNGIKITLILYIYIFLLISYSINHTLPAKLNL